MLRDTHLSSSIDTGDTVTVFEEDSSDRQARAKEYCANGKAQRRAEVECRNQTSIPGDLGPL